MQKKPMNNVSARKIQLFLCRKKLKFLLFAISQGHSFAHNYLMASICNFYTWYLWL